MSGPSSCRSCRNSSSIFDRLITFSIVCLTFSSLNVEAADVTVAADGTIGKEGRLAGSASLMRRQSISEHHLSHESHDELVRDHAQHQLLTPQQKHQHHLHNQHKKQQTHQHLHGKTHGNVDDAAKSTTDDVASAVETAETTPNGEAKDSANSESKSEVETAEDASVAAAIDQENKADGAANTADSTDNAATVTSTTENDNAAGSSPQDAAADASNTEVNDNTAGEDSTGADDTNTEGSNSEAETAETATTEAPSESGPALDQSSETEAQTAEHNDGQSAEGLAESVCVEFPLIRLSLPPGIPDKVVASAKTWAACKQACAADKKCKQAVFRYDGTGGGVKDTKCKTMADWSATEAVHDLLPAVNANRRYKYNSAHCHAPGGAKGKTGLNGTKGSTGPRGERGDQGQAGEIGDQGNTGKAGLKGETGEVGDAGPKPKPVNTKGLFKPFHLVVSAGMCITMTIALYVVGGKLAKPESQTEGETVAAEPGANDGYDEPKY
eukprot:TRINITY_DN48563_c0_g1_i1.p1 TRINITY_DN48563_c0_g1~~TRINITY_DN48563_c0_g1_i1.p1  ORF type:complete len:498 (-),score=104.08 TRINITY_DN48563_c0_g1_i1:94-1587(-)